MNADTTPLPRRDFIRTLSAALPAFSALAAQAQQPAAKPSAHDMSAMPATWTGSEVIVMLLYPQFTALDLLGPQYFLASLMGAKVLLVAKDAAPVACDTGVKMLPDITFEQCPEKIDLLCVPGGSSGTLAAMQDDATLRFVREKGGSARIAASVCTGSLLLGAAGLLQGRKATSHWLVKDLLPRFGATPAEDRVVEDGRVITAAGVTAGLDLGLHLTLKWRDRLYAECMALLAEYAPAPPVQAGDPARSPAQAVEMMRAMLAGFHQKVSDAYPAAR
jgi:putative intracellular protease/amidase